MCGFMVSTQKRIDQKKFEKEFKKIKYRGPDMSRIIMTSNGTWGFHRLSIMGLEETGMQPFIREKTCWYVTEKFMVFGR